MYTVDLNSVFTGVECTAVDRRKGKQKTIMRPVENTHCTKVLTHYSAFRV